MRETDLYPPVKAWLTANGYAVRAEVNGCDVAARKGNDLVLIELKKTINLELLLQIAGRQRVCGSVYAAVPRPAVQDRRWRALSALVKRLEAGLLLVSMEEYSPRVQIAFHPMPCPPRKDKRVTRAVLAEMAGRSLDLNTGGSTGRKLMTAYREQALVVAVALSEAPSASPAELRRMGAPDKTGAILYDNHYGWFERLGKGSYALSAGGREALQGYAEMAGHIRKALRGTRSVK